MKEFKTVVQKLQTSLKREKQLHTLKAINEKNKAVSFINNKIQLQQLIRLSLAAKWTCWTVGTIAITTYYHQSKQCTQQQPEPTWKLENGKPIDKECKEGEEIQFEEETKSKEEHAQWYRNSVMKIGLSSV